MEAQAVAGRAATRVPHCVHLLRSVATAPVKAWKNATTAICRAGTAATVRARPKKDGSASYRNPHRPEGEHPAADHRAERAGNRAGIHRLILMFWAAVVP